MENVCETAGDEPIPQQFDTTEIYLYKMAQYLGVPKKYVAVIGDDPMINIIDQFNIENLESTNMVVVSIFDIIRYIATDSEQKKSINDITLSMVWDKLSVQINNNLTKDEIPFVWFKAIRDDNTISSGDTIIVAQLDAFQSGRLHHNFDQFVA